MRALEQREKKLVALLIAFALLAALWLVAIEPLGSGFLERAAERVSLRAEYERDRRLAAGYQTWRAQLADQKATIGKFEIGGGSQQAASDALSLQIKRDVLQAGGTIKSIQMVDDATPDEVRVSATLQLTMEQLYRTLKQIEIGVPYVVVEYLSIGADTALKTGHLGPMDVRVEISAQTRPTDTPAQ